MNKIPTKKPTTKELTVTKDQPTKKIIHLNTTVKKILQSQSSLKVNSNPLEKELSQNIKWELQDEQDNTLGVFDWGPYNNPRRASSFDSPKNFQILL